jgi:ribonuclease P protein component
VVRSRVKRRLRELFRRKRSLLPDSADVVFIARTVAAKASFDRLRRDWEALAAQARCSGEETRPSR